MPAKGRKKSTKKRKVPFWVFVNRRRSKTPLSTRAQKWARTRKGNTYVSRKRSQVEPVPVKKIARRPSGRRPQDLTQGNKRVRVSDDEYMML